MEGAHSLTTHARSSRGRSFALYTAAATTSQNRVKLSVRGYSTKKSVSVGGGGLKVEVEGGRKKRESL